MKPGAWLIVAGGWNEQQFAEKRRPTQAELEAAAPDNPVYVQLGYGWVAMTEEGFAALGIKSRRRPAARARAWSRTPAASRSGRLPAATRRIVALFDRLPKPTYAEQVEGTRAFFRELNRLGLTGVGDPGGNNLAPPDYAALFDVWRRGEMTVRVRYSLNGQTRGQELQEFKAWTGLLPMGFGDDWLKFIGLGERVTEAMNNNPSPTADDIARVRGDRPLGGRTRPRADDALGARRHRRAAARHLRAREPRGAAGAAALVDCAPQRRLRGVAAAHARPGHRAGRCRTRCTSAATASSARTARPRRAGRRRSSPASKLGVPIGAGTDAHRVASYNPFTALQWFLDGKTVSGRAIRGPEETPSRIDALRFYTIGSAWFSHEERTRGSIEAGKLADLAVLSQDYLTVPVEKIGSTASLLTRGRRPRRLCGRALRRPGPAPHGLAPDHVHDRGRDQERGGRRGRGAPGRAPAAPHRPAGTRRARPTDPSRPGNRPTASARRPSRGGRPWWSASRPPATGPRARSSPAAGPRRWRVRPARRRTRGRPPGTRPRPAASAASSACCARSPRSPAGLRAAAPPPAAQSARRGPA